MRDAGARGRGSGVGGRGPGAGGQGPGIGDSGEYHMPSDISASAPTRDDPSPATTRDAGRGTRDDPSPADLASLRARIDDIDRQLVDLLNRRAEVSIEIGQAKGQDGIVYDPVREAAVYERLVAELGGPLPAGGLKAIYREIISSSRALQTPLRVAFLGPEATFSHQAALYQFGSSTELVPVPTIPDVFKETELGRTRYGVVPIENSTEGAVSYSLDSFVDSDLTACAEIRLEVHQALMSRLEMDDISTVYSHPQAIAQSRGWLRTHLPDVPIVEVASTVGAAEEAARREGAAAIGPEVAAGVYGLRVLHPRIEDVPGNVTRFLVIGREVGGPTGHDRMAVLFSIKDRVGVLRDVLAEFAAAGMNLTKIESRPSKRRAWDYLFFADLDAHPADPAVADALRRLEDLTVFVKVLGAWSRTD
ncbi:MAG: prephenate dehydratase [Chloroflexota bacterium]